MQIIKKILNINLDRNSNNSAATVGMVNEIHPFTKNYIYRKYFEDFLTLMIQTFTFYIKLHLGLFLIHYLLLQEILQEILHFQLKQLIT